MTFLGDVHDSRNRVAGLLAGSSISQKRKIIKRQVVLTFFPILFFFFQKEKQNTPYKFSLYTARFINFNNYLAFNNSTDKFFSYNVENIISTPRKDSPGLFDNMDSLKRFIPVGPFPRQF